MVFRHGPGSRTAVDIDVAGKDQGGAGGFRGRESVLRKERDEPRPLGVRDRRRMDNDVHAADRLDDRFARAKVRCDHLDPRRESRSFSAGTDHGADLVAREPGSAHDGASNQSPGTEDRKPHVHRTIAAREKDDASNAATAYVHDACTSPPYGREATVSRRPASVRRGGGGRWAAGTKWGPARRDPWASGRPPRRGGHSGPPRCSRVAKS